MGEKGKGWIGAQGVETESVCNRVVEKPGQLHRKSRKYICTSER